MKAILLAAGFGTRLRPLTDKVPKCLVKVKNRPLLGIWLEKLISLGINDILINTHYLSEQVVDFIENSPYKEYVTLAFERELLGTAGTLVANSNFWKNNECLVIHADNYCGSTLSGLLDAHKSRPPNTDLTMLLFETSSPKNCGIVQVSNKGIIKEFHEKPEQPKGKIANGALFLFGSSVYDKYFANLDQGTYYDLSQDIVPSFVGSMYGWVVDAAYIDIGTPETLERAQDL